MIKLSEKERRVLSVIQLNARISNKEVAKITGYQEKTVARTISRMKEAGFLRQSVFVNTTALGFIHGGILCSIDLCEGRSYDALKESLSKAQEINFVAELGGKYQYQIQGFFPTLSSFDSFLLKFTENHGVRLVKKCPFFLQSLALLGSQYLWPDFKPVRELVRCDQGVQKEKLDIDVLDHEILQLLSRDGSLSIQKLSQSIGESSSTIAYRIKRLEQNRILLGFYYIIEASLFGMHPFVFLVSFSNLSAGTKLIFEAFCRQQIGIDTLIRTIAEFDFMLYAYFDSQNSAVHLERTLKDSFSDSLRSVELLPLFRVPKGGDYPFNSYQG